MNSSFFLFRSRACCRRLAPVMALSLVAAVMSSPCAKAEETKKSSDATKTAAADPNQRPAGEVTILTKDGEKKVKLPAREFLAKDGTLTLYPGDEVNIEFQEKDGKLAEPKVVAQVGHPERTITFTMSQEKEMTMLTRKTQIGKTVALDCRYGQIGSSRTGVTLLYPTEKGMAGFDSWESDVTRLMLSHLEVLDVPAGEAYKAKTH